MVKSCQICSKKGLTGFSVSHSHQKTKRRQHPNLQKRKVDGRRVWVCTKCIKKTQNPKPKIQTKSK